MSRAVPKAGEHERRVAMEVSALQGAARRHQEDRHMEAAAAAHHSSQALQVSRHVARQDQRQRRLSGRQASLLGQVRDATCDGRIRLSRLPPLRHVQSHGHDGWRPLHGHVSPRQDRLLVPLRRHQRAQARRTELSSQDALVLHFILCACLIDEPPKHLPRDSC